MKEILKDFYGDMLIGPFQEEGILWPIFGVVLWGIVIFLVVLVFSLFVWIIDSSFLPTKSAHGTIVEKYVIPSHTTIIFNKIGDTHIPQTIYHPTQYIVRIGVNGLTGDISIPATRYDNIIVGRSVWCEYASGRILPSIYIKSFK